MQKEEVSNITCFKNIKDFSLFFHQLHQPLLTHIFCFFILAAFQASKSTNDLGNMFRSQILQLQQNVAKKTKKRGISQYMADDDDDDDSEFDDNDGDDVLDDGKNMAG